MSSLLASFNFSFGFTVTAAFVIIGVPIVAPVSVLSHWLSRRFLVASSVAPAFVCLFLLGWLPVREFRREDWLVSICVVGLSAVLSSLLGLPFLWVRRRRLGQPTATDENSVPSSQGEAQPPADFKRSP